MFKLDEITINEQFGCRLDIMPSNVAARSVDFPKIGWLSLIRLPGLALLRLLGCEEAEMGFKVIFSNRLLEQRNKDTIKIIMQQAIDVITEYIVAQHYSIGHLLSVGPLMFEYAEGMVIDDLYKGRLTLGVEVVIVTLVKWNSLG